MVKPLRHVYYNHQTLFSIEDHVMYLQSNRYQDDDTREIEDLQEYILHALEPSVKSLIQKYLWDIEFDDALSEARMTILDCIKNYHPDKNTSFKTYALKMIQYMLYDLNQEETFEFQVPKYIAKSYYSYQKDDSKSRTPLELEHIKTYQSLNTHKKRYIHDDDYPFIPSSYDNPEETYVKEIQETYLQEAIQTLNDREKDVIEKLYLDETSQSSLSNLSKTYNVSNPMMTKIHKQALSKIKAYLNQSPLKKIKQWLKKI